MGKNDDKKFTKNIGWAGGVNKLVKPRALRDDQLANGKNCWPTEEGILAKRHAVTFERLAVKDPSVQYFPIAMFQPDPTTGFQFVIHYADGFGNEYIRAGAFDNSLEADCPFIQVAAGSPMNFRPMSFANYRGAVIAVGAGNEGFYQLTQSSAGEKHWGWHKVSFDWTGFDVAATQSQATPIKPNTVGVYRDRLVFADFGVGMGNWLIMSDRVGPWAYQLTGNDDAHRDNVPLWSQVGPDVLALNGRHVEIMALQGQSILSLEEASTASVANALQRALLVRTNTRANIVTGEIAETTDTGTTYSSYLGDWVPADVNIDAGIAGPHCHCRGPNGIFWANGEDVYALYDGAPRPVVIGTNIRPALRACPQSFHLFWHMAYADGAVYLSLATQNSTNELNLTIQHWRLDIRPTGNGDETAKPMGASEARWFGPQDYEHLPNTDVDQAGRMGACIMARRGQDDQDTVYGLFFGAGNNDGSLESLFIISYNRVLAGYDAPYRVVTSARRWAANDQVVVGDLICGTPLTYDGFFYVCSAITTGITGPNEPTWPGAGGTAVDGGVTWTEISLNQQAFRTPTFVPADTEAWRIPMEPDFKDYDFGLSMVDKVFVKLDVSAYLDVKQLVWAEVLGNGGDLKMQMGPAVIGDFTLGRYTAHNDLGLAQLDISSLAESFQARRLSPSDTSRGFVSSVVPGVVRARTLQSRFRDGAGFVIDSSNDHLVVAAYAMGAGVPAVNPLVVSVALTQGFYENTDDLTNHIVTQLNAQASGFIPNTGPFSTVSAFTGASPYTVNITNNATAIAYIAVFLFALDSDASTLNGVQLYLQRSMRLMATLGFDTSDAYGVALTGAGSPALYPLDNGANAQVLGPNLTNVNGFQVATISAIQSIPFQNSPIVAITELKGTYVRKSNQPVGTVDRQS